jgi:2-C-methyl-D-erythritol 2,4-cyclodiphosphate synthase
MLTRTGIGFDAHRFAEGRRLVLGGVAIPSSMGLAGHSDADVLAHAITDAILGAAGEGDIGLHFPDTDARWKDANSLDLLRRAVERIGRKGWRVANVDSTVLAETPRLAPHVAAMRAALGKAAGVKAERVSVKATTVEGMGALGRREGIAAMAVAMIEKRPAGERVRRPRTAAAKRRQQQPGQGARGAEDG